MNNDIDVSVVIPHFDDLVNLDRCLNLLTDQDLQSVRMEVIIADNNSKCGLAAVKEVVRGRGLVVAATEQGAGPARNLGAAGARGKTLAFIDSDCRPQRNWVMRAKYASQHSDITGGRVVVEPEFPAAPTPVEAFEMVFAFRFDHYIKKKGFTGSGNMVVRRDVFNSVGGFKSGLSEDVEWSHRASSFGYRIEYDPMLVVSHPARSSWNELTKKFDRICRESYLLAKSKSGWQMRWLFRSTIILISPLPHTFKLILASNELPNIRDRIRAIPILYSIRIRRFVQMNLLLFSGVSSR